MAWKPELQKWGPHGLPIRIAGAQTLDQENTLVLQPNLARGLALQDKKRQEEVRIGTQRNGLKAQLDHKYVKKGSNYFYTV